MPGPDRCRRRPVVPDRRRRRLAAATALAATLLLTLGAVVGAQGPDRVPRTPPLLVTVGEVTEASAVVWARAAGPDRVEVAVTPAGSAGPRRALAAEATAATDFAVKLRADGLTPATRHDYEVRWRGERLAGRFVTAPDPTVAGPVHLVWSGDLGGAGRCRSPASGYPIFRAMAARRPDAFLFVGDTVYTDQRCPVPKNVAGSAGIATDLQGFRTKTRYNRADPAVQAFFLATSVYAVWDDHEVRNDFAGPSEPLMAIGRRAFLEYWPIEPPPDDPGRLYRRARWGRSVEIFILDTRQYRSANTVPDGPHKTMLGAAQREWLLGALTRSDAVWKLIVSSVSLSIPTGREARDGWANGSTRFSPRGSPTGFEHELLTIVRELAARRVANVVWLVADVHRAEVIRHEPLPGLVFHEMVAGPLSAGLGRPGALDDTLRPTRLFAEGGFDSFGELRVTRADLTVRILDAEGRSRFEATVVPR